MSKLNEINPQNLQEAIKNEDVVLIDIRREDEWIHTGIIQSSKLLTFFDMFGNADVLSWTKEFNKYVVSKDQKIVLICAHANRTRVVGDYLLKNDYTEVFHLEGGIANWIRNNLVLNEYKKEA